MATFADQLELLFRSRCTLIIIVTPEEERALKEVMLACNQSKQVRRCLRWDCGLGLRNASGEGKPVEKDAKTLFEEIRASNGRDVYVLHDMHDYWDNNYQIKRAIRSLAQDLRNSRTTLVITTPTNKIPPELEDEATVINLSLPEESHLDKLLGQILEALPDPKIGAPTRRRIVQAAVGLTESQARRAFSEAVVSDGVLSEDSIKFVMSQKQQVIRQSDFLEFFSSDETLDNVGGFAVLKAWLREREPAFSKNAAEYGLPAPKGVVLLGIPGTGKSLTAKMIGGLWKMPLLRLDVGAIFNQYLGQSEERLRKATQLAETIAPCVLWIDEMEKALAQGGLDGGTATRVFGSLLSWMQDKKAPVFIVATANDVSRLPPELLRRGRFDEIFFLDLPNDSERAEIIKVHLKKRRRNPDLFNIVEIAEQCEGFVGAEIEQAINDAMYAAFSEKQREFTTQDILLAASRLVPLAKSQRERIQELRDWLNEGRALSASAQPELRRSGGLEIS
jgi:SpoVK/Ycf46/Vps4 family AAA+-type ATPase